MATIDMPDATARGIPASRGLVDRTVEAIHNHIRTGKLGPGAALPPESALALELGVSRAVIREAFRSLVTLRFINIGSGRRARVGTIDKSVFALLLDHAVHTDQTTIQQIYDVRRSIELRTVGLAAMRRSGDQADELVGLAAAMRADFATPARVMEHDIGFHEAIARASCNPMFNLLVGSFHIITRQTWQIGWQSRPTDAERMAMVQGHEAIADLVRRRDHKAAERAMADHFDLSVQALLAAGIN